MFGGEIWLAQSAAQRMRRMDVLGNVLSPEYSGAGATPAPTVATDDEVWQYDGPAQNFRRFDSLPRSCSSCRTRQMDRASLPSSCPRAEPKSTISVNRPNSGPLPS